jgi:hypothetical protein
VRGEDGVVTIVERQLDFEGAIVLQFGRAIARDLVAFVEAAPSEKNDSSAVFDFGGGLDGTEGKFCPTVTTHPEIGWPREIEVVAIPQIGFDNPPLADEFAGGRAHHGVDAISLVSESESRRLYYASANLLMRSCVEAI